MRFEKIIPTERLKPYIKYLAISEDTQEQTYKIFPSTGLVIGFQYKGNLFLLNNAEPKRLSASGITGLADSFKVFKNSPGIGTILVFFNETGITHFTRRPANELFNQSVSLEQVFDKHKIAETEDRLSIARTDQERIRIVERLLIKELKEKQNDLLVMKAVKLIYESKGTVRIKELNEKLFISQSPLEKRFRKLVGASPKKFASIVRFNAVLNALESERSLSDLCYENNFFDQAHFIKDFKRYTGDTPEAFKRFL